MGLLWLSPFIAQPDVAYDSVGVAVFCVTAVTELLTEPLWVLAQMHHYVSLKVAMATRISYTSLLAHAPGNDGGNITNSSVCGRGDWSYYGD